MPRLPRAGILTLLMALTTGLLAPTQASASYQSTSDAAVYPLAICRDGMRFLFAADFYPEGEDPGTEPPFRVQSVQAATPVPPVVDGRAIPPNDARVLDVTVNVPNAPQEIDFDNFYQAPVFPQYPPVASPSGPYPQPTGVQTAEYAGDYTLAWNTELKAGARKVVLSFDRFDPASNSVELIADVSNCKLFDD
jgi:hypothetical protein